MEKLFGAVRTLALAALFLGLTGCGPLTIRTWVTVLPDESSGEFILASRPGRPPTVLPFQALQGGFQATVRVNTNDLLTGVLAGTIEVEDVRLAGEIGGVFGTICTYRDPAAPSAGTVTLDLVGGASSADLVLDLKIGNDLLGADIEQPVHFELGDGLTLDTLLAAAASGSADGLFATRTVFAGDATVEGPFGPIQASYHIDLGVTNGAEPPAFDAALLEPCQALFDEQGRALFHGLNAKSSYLRAKPLPTDSPASPLVISLAGLGAAPGDTLRIATVGTYGDATSLADGSDRRASAVFSATDTVLGPNVRVRVPDAIDAGNNVLTYGWIECPSLFVCRSAMDIGQDFRVDPSVDVVVPAGANFLIVAPLPPSLFWSDDSGFGFGVDIEVNPAS